MPESSTLAFDVGGSFVKAGLVDVAAGCVTGQVLRRPTPEGAAPTAVIDLLDRWPPSCRLPVRWVWHFLP